MEIKNIKIKVADIVKGYYNDNEKGVGGYDGKLNIRPEYQREFVYKDKQRDEVINTVRKGFPLNVMYWAVSDDGRFEVMDGQQRTISVCDYVAGKFSINNMYFHNLQQDEKDVILNYQFDIYQCKGENSEKLEWFKTINIAGEKLFDQELRNAIYTGPWLSDAKRHFSKTGCAAYGMGEKYMSGSPIRQDYLETAIKWINNNNVEEYMANHQHDPNANELWLYFQKVINWVKIIFPNYRKEMKGIDWGELYGRYCNNNFDVNLLEEKIKQLMKDDDVTNKKGIYAYVLDGQEKHLNIRSFSDNMKREAYERQNGICANCGQHFEITQMEGDHITPWHLGGKTNAENCQMLCKECNRRKSGK